MRLWIFQKLTKLRFGSSSAMRICGCSPHPRQKRNCVQRRSRFYQSVMDSSLLKSGDESFNLLNDTFNIIITPFDLFGEGRYCYTFHARCDENPSLVLEDGATRIFLNTRGTNRNEISEELIQFLEYMEQSTLNVAIPDTNGNLIKIHNYVRQVKASEEIGVKFMQ